MTDPSSTVEIPAAGTYRIDPATSKIAFTAKHMFGTGTVKGSFALTSGEIVVAELVTTSQVTAAASAQSFESASPKRDELTLRAAGKVDRYAHGITKLKGMAGRYLTLDISAHAARS